MNRVLDYAARPRRWRRGTVYGMASMVMAGIVLAAPMGIIVMNMGFEYLMRQSLGTLPSFEIYNWAIDGPLWATLGLSAVGVLLGAVALSLRSKRDWMVLGGVVVNIAGLIAAVGVICLMG